MLGELAPMALIDKPPYMTGAFEDYSESDIRWIAGQFQIPHPVRIGRFPGRGNINLHTYQVTAGDCEYLLQKVNAGVFTMPFRVMNSMVTVLEAQTQALAEHPVDGWVPIELIPTSKGTLFLDLTDEHGWSVWRLMVRIPESVSYKSLGEVAGREAQLRLASEAGRGLAIYSSLTSSIDADHVAGSLPGYRDTGLYYRLFHSVMAGNRLLGEAETLLPHDSTLRASTEKHFLVHCDEEEHQARKNDPELTPYLRILQEQEPFAMGLWTALAEGRIRKTLIHGDPKIENFLFCSRSGRVKSLVDLDTIMAFTWLNDYGDMIRSLVNVAGEKERDLDRVVIDEDVFEAVTRGFLSASRGITEQERLLMYPAVMVATLELGLRFLTDYIRGDSYFQLGENDPADLNKVRAMVQLRLYQRFVEFAPKAQKILEA